MFTRDLAHPVDVDWPDWVLFVDGKVLRTANGFNFLTFSPDGNRLGGAVFQTNSDGTHRRYAFVDEWNKRGHPFEGLTEGFRGHDGIATIAEAIKVAGKDEPKAIQAALWNVKLTGVNGPIKFEKDGPAGKESGQSKPSIFVVQIRDGKVALPDFLAKK